LTLVLANDFYMTVI